MREKQTVLDFKSALHATADNDILAHKLLAVFLSQLPKYQSDIIQHLESDNNAELQKCIHKLNSASLYIGAPSLRQLAGELDGTIDKLSKESPKKLSIKIDNLLQLLNQIKTEQHYSL